MGSTAQSAQLTPSTFIEGITFGATLLPTRLESSGQYFNVGDASKIIIFVNNGSSDAGAIYVEPGARWSGSRGQAPSTIITTYSTATAPIAVSIAGCVGSTLSTLHAVSTTGCFQIIGPFDSAMVKSSNGEIFIGPSSSLAVLGVAVYAMKGGSTQ